MLSKISILFICIFSVALSTAQTPVKVFLLAGQSNMQGHAQISQLEKILCALDALDLADDPMNCYDELSDVEDRLFETISDFYWTGTEYGYGYEFYQAEIEANAIGALSYVDASLLEEMEQVQVLNYNYARDGDGNHYPPAIEQGGLQTGFGASTNKYGPELTFGHKLYEVLGQDILLIKVAEGGSDLHVKWRSPSMVERLGEGEVPSLYPVMIQRVQELLEDPQGVISAYEGKDVALEMAGFVWFQGFNDTVESTGEYAENYEQNLTDLINDLRNDLNTPSLAVAIGKTHNDGGDKGLIVMAAQDSVAKNMSLVNAAQTNDLSNFYHFDSGSHLVIGDRLAINMLDLLSCAIELSLSFNGYEIESSQNPNSNYQWVNCLTGIEISGATSASFVPLDTGSYAVIIDQNGCIELSDCINISAISSITKPKENRIQVFPNPVHDILFISGVETPIKLAIFDMLGQEKYEGIVEDGLVKLESLTTGSYILQLDNQRLVFVKL